MRISPVIAVAVVGFATLLIATFWREHRPGAGFRGQARPLVDDAEAVMYARLVQAFPEGVVLVKVALAALMSVPLRERDNLRHRHVDFVLCDRALRVLGAVQLEVSEELEAFRIGESAKVLLEAAGYTVLAFDEPPEVPALRAALLPLLAAGPRALRTDAYAPGASSD